MILEICNQGINDFWGINTSDLILEVFILVPFSLGLKRYYREQQFKRSEYFFNLRSIYKGHEDYNSLRSLLKERNKDNVKEIDKNAELEIKKLSKIKLYDYAGFFEELQISIRSGFVKKEMVYYFFGTYILDTQLSTHFKDTINRNQPLWTIFYELLDEMEKINRKNLNNQNLIFDKKTLKF